MAGKEMIEEYQSHFRDWAFDAFLNTSWVDNPDLKWFGTRINEAFHNPEKKSTTPFIFGLCGNAGTGKDSATEYLRFCPYIHNGVCNVALADPIKEIARIFGFTREQMSDRTLKETEDPFWGFSPRTFMQKVGTEMFRNCLREDIWIKLLEKKILKLKTGDFDTLVPTMIFVTDVRFPNEAEAIREMGGYIIKITREGFSKSGENLHPSEKFIAEMKADYEIENKAKDADEWAWSFAKWLTIFIKHDAFYDLH